MCGIAGYISFKEQPSDKFNVAISIMAIEMEPRGQQAWGWLSDTEYYKSVGKITETFHLPEIMPKRFVLHTRYGTHGDNVTANCHPFFFKDKHFVAGVHNGVISNHEDLNVRHNRSNDVDSQHIFQSIAEGKSIDDLVGYGAVVYQKDEKWYIGRFNGGEMTLAVTLEGVFFASTFDAVKLAMAMARIPVSYYATLKDSTVYELTEFGVKKSFKVKLEETDMRWDDSMYDDVLGKFRGNISKGGGYVGYTGSHRSKGLTRFEREDRCSECFKHLEPKDAVTIFNASFCEDCAIDQYGYLALEDYEVREATFGEDCVKCHKMFNEKETLWNVECDGARICTRCFNERFTLEDGDSNQMLLRSKDDTPVDAPPMRDIEDDIEVNDEAERYLLLEAQNGGIPTEVAEEAASEQDEADKAFVEAMMSKVTVGAWDAN